MENIKAQFAVRIDGHLQILLENGVNDWEDPCWQKSLIGRLNLIRRGKETREGLLCTHKGRRDAGHRRACQCLHDARL